VLGYDDNARNGTSVGTDGGIEVATSAVTTPRVAPGRQTSRAGRGASWTVRERERDRHVTPTGDDSRMNVSDVVEILPAIYRSNSW
jgi:hypothetical protein